MKKVLEFKGNDKIIDLTIELQDGKLSICGTVWDKHRSPRTEKTLISGSQCIDECRGVVPKKLLDIWERWHLNDMRTGCEHQRKITLTNISIPRYTWGDKYNELRRQVEGGIASPDDYQKYCEIQELISDVCYSRNNELHTAEIKDALAAGWLKLDKIEVKNAGWVYEHEHKDGYLLRPCPECGYKYGSAWLKEELPADVVQYIESL